MSKFPRRMSALAPPQIIIKRRAIKKSILEGSFENRLSQVTPAVILASGCERPNGEASKATGHPAHDTHVIATFGDYAFVECGDEGKVWKVPFEFNDDGIIKTGEPTEVEDVFEPANDRIAALT